MSFSALFSRQAKKPSGLFGKIVMSNIFNFGNAFINEMVNEIMTIQNCDRVLDIGCGTGKLIRNMSNQIRNGYIEGIDFSNSMVSIARKKNKILIRKGMVKIVEGDFDALSYQNESFNKVCSVNTIYFWPNPDFTARKIVNILKPGGILVIAFEDIRQLEQRDLDHDVFSFYPTKKVKDLLSQSGFKTEIEVITKTKGKLKFHCIVAEK